jgi:peroxiredoxin
MQTDREPLAIGAVAPDFDLPATDGSRVRSADLDAEVLVYVQGCNHCPYVVAYVDRLKRLAHAYAARGVAFVMVNANDASTHPDDDLAGMQAFAREHDLPFPYLWDEDQSVSMAYRTVRTPELLVFDGERRLRYHGRIDDSPKDPEAVTKQDLRDALDALLAGEEIAEPETWAVGCTVKWKPENAPAID